MINTSDFLVEFFSEEIPARMQSKGAQDFQSLFLTQFDQAGLSYDAARVYVTPRRLALIVRGLQTQQSSQQIETRGPRVDAPDAAIAGFLASVGLSDVAQLETRATPKGDFFFFNRVVAGRRTVDLIPEIVNHVFKNLVWPKSMRWGSNTAMWVRPLRNVLCIFEAQVVPGAIDLGAGVLSFNDQTWGHRFMAPASIQISDPTQYLSALASAYVLADPAQRSATIQSQMSALAQPHGLTLPEDAGLLEEVTGLVEWPVALMGTIDARYMHLPPEVLVTSLKVNQKYFTLQDVTGTLAPVYMVVANIMASDGGAAILEGNARVLNARLADAEFFYQHDLKKNLEDFLTPLHKVIFHADLGTMAARVERLEAYATHIAQQLEVDTASVARAARLAKLDLCTEMVGEFANLQGIMGAYYAQAQGENMEVSQAILDHYKPKGPTDTLPRHLTGSLVALADKLDTLVGFFAVGIKPTGSKDPFALRRAALGILRILETLPALDLPTLLGTAYDLNAPTLNPQKVLLREAAVQETALFLTERAKTYWREQGLRLDCIEAVLKGGALQMPAQQRTHIQALHALVETPVGQDLVAVYKRAANIVRLEEEKDGQQYTGIIDAQMLINPHEQALYSDLQARQAPIQNALARDDAATALAEAASLRPALDAFFTHVTVNAPQPEIRRNRLALLACVRHQLQSIAHFESIEG